MDAKMRETLPFLFLCLVSTNFLTQAGGISLTHQTQISPELRKGYTTQEHPGFLPSKLRRTREVPITDEGHPWHPKISTDGESKRPIVNHHKITAAGTFRRSRRKRSANKDGNQPNIHSIRDKISRFLDYDGWSPMDVSDPMSNQPTIYYQPPALTRVHFGEDPPAEEPLYPIIPKNPPVFVIRAEQPASQIDRIYGTEKFNYVHINPLKNLTAAFPSGRENDIKVYEVFPSKETDDSTPSYFQDSDPEFSWQPKPGYKPFLRNEKQSNLEISENLDYVYEPNQDDTEYSQPNPSESANPLPSNLENKKEFEIYEVVTMQDNAGKTNNIKHSQNENSQDGNFLDRKQDLLLINTEGQGKSLSDSSFDLTDNKELNPTPLYDDSEFSDKTLMVDDGVYYYYDDYPSPSNDYPLVENKDLETSASDPFASIIPLEPSDDNAKADLDSFLERGDHVASGSEVREKSVPIERTSLHELLRGFDGVQYDRYIFSASENDERSILHALPPSDFRFKQKSQRKYTSFKNDPYRNLNENSFRPWYLIRTKAESPRKSKKNRQFFATSRRLSGYDDSNSFYEPFPKKSLKNLKPSETLTANTLSELLQIFKYVTTPSPYPSTKKKPKVTEKVKSFRYTKPTESPLLEDSTKRTKVYTTFRYTLPTSKLESPTESPFETSTQPYDLPGIPPPLNDSVAETNSIDGYLFSDSETAPEYSKPEASINIIKIVEKEIPVFPVHPKLNRSEEKTRAKDPGTPVHTELKVPDTPVHTKLKRPDEKPKTMDADAHRRGDIEHRLIIDTGNVEVQSRSIDHGHKPRPNYFIHQGHSKVKIFGGAESNQKSYVESVTQRKMMTGQPKIGSTIRSMGKGTSLDDTSITDIPELDELENNSNTEGYESETSTATNEVKEPLEDSDYADWLRPNLKLPNPPSPDQVMATTEANDRNYEGGLLPSAIEAFTRLFYGDLTPVNNKSSSDSLLTRDLFGVTEPEVEA